MMMLLELIYTQRDKYRYFKASAYRLQTWLKWVLKVASGILNLANLSIFNNSPVVVNSHVGSNVGYDKSLHPQGEPELR